MSEPIIAAIALTVGSEVAIDIMKEPIVNSIRRFLTSSTHRVEREIQQQQRDEELADVLARRVRTEFSALVEELDSRKVQERFDAAAESSKPSISDAANLTERAAHLAEKSSNIQKRKLLAAALVNSFDPTLYAAGQSAEVLSILEQLSSPDVRMLELCKGKNFRLFQEHLDTFHFTSAIKLVELRLLVHSRSHGQTAVGENSQVRASALGHQVLEHIEGHTAWPPETSPQ